MDIYQFMTEIYEMDQRNGVPAPFLEYALSSTWMDKSYTYLNRIWYDGDKIVGFVFYEAPVTNIYFSLRPGYEELATEMVNYANQHMPDFGGNRQFILSENQKAIIDAAKKLGYEKVYEEEEMIYQFDEPLNYELPAGFRFVPQGTYDIEKIELCCWKGFDHEEEGPWDGDAKNSYQLCQAPHATVDYAAIIENEAGEYVCYAGMWWTPGNHLAYMEPLCTVPKYRGLGLAAAALSELYRRLEPLGATHMTGGANPFYKKIGFEYGVKSSHWKKLKGSEG